MMHVHDNPGPVPQWMVFVLGALAGIFLSAIVQPDPPLVGRGCIGTAGEIYAYEEGPLPGLLRDRAPLSGKR